MHFGSSPLARFTESFGRMFTIYAYKNEAVCLEVQTQFGSSPPARFIEKVVGTISRFMRPKRSCLPWRSDVFWKFYACKVYRKSSGRNFTISASKNDAVCHEVQTQFGSTPFARFTEKVLGAISRFMRPKRSRLLWSWDAFWKFSLCEVHEKVLSAISRFMRPKRSCLTWKKWRPLFFWSFTKTGWWKVFSMKMDAF